MPADRDASEGRRPVVPPAAAHSLWLSAAWTGAMAALVGAVMAIAAVAICWLPASGRAGNAGSAIRAGILTFLAALHGGITVDGVPAAFVPLGLTVAVGIIAWRAGCGLADAAADLEETRSAQLVQAALVQVGVFAVVCTLAAGYCRLGTSSAGPVSTFVGAGLVFACSGGVGFVWASPLREVVTGWWPSWAVLAGQAAAAGVAVYVGAGSLLVAASLVLHHGRVEALSHQVGGGWSGAPVLLLGVLAVPNAALAGASYLAGPGFAVGSGSGVSLSSTVHGTLPAFPVLAAVPSGPAGTPAWLLATVTPLAAGAAVARIARSAGSWRARFAVAGAAAGAAALLGLVLGWLAGGAIGSGRLNAIGPSPWQFGLAVGAALGAVSTAALGALAVLAWARGRVGSPAADAPVAGPSAGGDGLTSRAWLTAVSDDDEAEAKPEESGSDDQLAG